MLPEQLTLTRTLIPDLLKSRNVNLKGPPLFLAVIWEESLMHRRHLSQVFPDLKVHFLNKISKEYFLTKNSRQFDLSETDYWSTGLAEDKPKEK